MTFPLPDPYIGGLPTRIKPEHITADEVADPVKLAKILQQFNERFNGNQLNWEALQTGFSVSNAQIALSGFDSLSIGIGLALTTSPQDRDANITVAATGDYLIWVSYEFAITASEVGHCTGQLKVGSLVGNQTAVFGVASTISRGTVSTFHHIPASAGDVVSYRVSKELATGTATFESGHVVMVGPFA